MRCRIRLPQTDRIHGQLNQTVAATGRLSSRREPNLQKHSDSGPNLGRADPAERSVGRARKTNLSRPIILSLELRLLAHITRDEVHARRFPKRRRTFISAYGTAWSLTRGNGTKELKEARRFCQDRKLRDRRMRSSPWGLSQRVWHQPAGSPQSDTMITMRPTQGCVVTWTRFPVGQAARARLCAFSLYGRIRPLAGGINDRHANIRRAAEARSH